MNIGSSAFISSGGQSGDASAHTSSYQTSRPSCMFTSPPVRLTTITVSTLGQSFRASSVLALRGTFLPPRKPSSAVMTQFESQPIIRADKLSGENPPNTIEWTAPIRVQASIATAASTTIGIYKVTRSPFLTPRAFIALDKRQTRSCRSR